MMASGDQQRRIMDLVIVGFLLISLQPSMKTTARSITEDPVGKGCVDIAIVGAGIGGSYTAWRLKDRGLRVSVFEYTDRVGGRLFSSPLPVALGTYLELGGMRFKKSAHPTFTTAVRNIGLAIVPFPLNYGNSEDTLWYLRNKHLRSTDFGTSRTPYNLDPKEVTDPDTLMWNIFNDNVNFSSNVYPSIEELYSLTTKDGTPVYKMSYDNYLSQYASKEAYNYVYDASGWEDAVGRHGALHGPKLFVPYPGSTGPSEGYSTIDGGMGKVPEALIKSFKETSATHKLHLNYQLIKISQQKLGGYKLRFRKTQSTDGITEPLEDSNDIHVCATKVILAVPRDCITRIDFATFRDNSHIMRNINSALDFPSGKVFLAYNTKWWKTNNSDITHIRSDLLSRQTYDWQTGNNNVSILLASYHDGDHVKYWRELSQFGTPIPGSLPGANAVTDVVKNRLEQFLSRIYRVKQGDIPDAVGGGMMLWDTYPFQAAWSYFKPGFDEREVRRIEN